MLHTGATRKYIVSVKSPGGVPQETCLLAPTFYDVRKHVDADMYRAIGEDVETLKKNGTTDAPHDLEGFPSRIQQIWQPPIIEFYGLLREQVAGAALEHGFIRVAR